MVFSIEPTHHVDFVRSVTESMSLINHTLTELQRQYYSIKFYIIFEVELKKMMDSAGMIFGFYTNTTTLLLGDDLDEKLLTCLDKVTNSIESFSRRGSGYIFEKITDVCLHVTQYKPISGTSFLPLPKELKLKKCLLNIKNMDEYCFMYCLLAALHPALQNAPPDTYKTRFNTLQFKGINFPVSLKDVSKIEKQNNLRINIFGFDEELKTGIFPCYISKRCQSTLINLLLLTDSSNKSHYVLIKNFDALLQSKTRFKHGMRFCPRCLLGFSTDLLLLRHSRECEKNEIQCVEMPKNNILKFDKFKSLLSYPVVIYADFESFLSPLSEEHNGNTILKDEHLPCTVAYKVVTCIPEMTKPVKVLCSRNCSDLFIEAIYKEYDEFKNRLEMMSEIRMSVEDEERYRNSKTCFVCDKSLDWTAVDINMRTVRHHNHFTSKFIAACHSICNLKIKKSQKIVILFHNLKGYDSKFIIRSLYRYTENPSEISVISSSMEKFLQITTSKFIFRDSYQLLSESLNVLVENLKDKGSENFELLRVEYPNEVYFQASLQKALFPYSYLTTFERLNDKIPPMKEFYNVLTDSYPSKKDYDHLMYQCELFDLKTLDDLIRYYCSLDVILLADVMESFRKMCLKDYELDAIAFPTLPSFGFNAMLKMTKVELELLSDPDMYSMIQSGIRGIHTTIV